MGTILAAAGTFDNDVKREKTVAGMREAIKRGIWPWQAPAAGTLACRSWPSAQSASVGGWACIRLPARVPGWKYACRWGVTGRGREGETRRRGDAETG